MVVALVDELDLGYRAGLSGILEPEPRIEEARDVELDLQTGDEAVPVRGQALQGPTQQVSCREGYRRAVREVDVAQHPASRLQPGQHAEGGRIRHHDDVARAL